ncbi:MAG TPA: carboxypeptidase-like regulatory domain-containing protein [Bacteroidales bacterium]|nr:carboxypeptidase-like regulatory domain-containing protein [Bacteroidales bacterium]
MKKIITFLFCFSCFITSNCQIIRGTVKDIQTKEPIEFASVYFSGTFAGKTTDQNGNFTLNVSKYSTMPLTISAIGYYSSEVSVYSADSLLKIYLKPKVYEIEEIVIHADSIIKKREENLKLFKDAFLGTTENSENCKIINEADISFNYFSDEDTLKAFTVKPLLIENRSLGYNIIYYLDLFEYYKKTERIYFSGRILFDDSLTFKGRSQRYYDRQRKLTYLGSRMHLFRTLYSEDSTSTGFTIVDSTNRKLSFKNIVMQETKGQKYIWNLGNLRIHYYQKFSFMNILTPKLYFDFNGYFDPQSVQWYGELANKRIADWLPYEYKLE